MRIKQISLIVASLVVALLALASAFSVFTVWAGDPDSPGGPTSDAAKMYTLEDIYNRLNDGTAAISNTFTEPTDGPGTGTMHDLNEIMGVAPAIDNTNGATETNVLDGKTFWGLTGGQWGPQTGTMPDRERDNASTAQSESEGVNYFTAPDGYYDGDDTVTATDPQVRGLDTDIVSGNIRSSVNIFGVDGDPMVVNTSSGDAVTGDIKDSKKAWVDGAEVTGNIPTQTVSNTTVSQLAGYYDAFDLSVVDTDLVSPNIRSTVSIFGVDGDPNVVDTSSGTATASEILTDRIAYVDGQEVTGTMPNNGAVTIVPTTTNQTIAAGYHDGSGYVEGDGNLVAGNIKSDVIIFGVTGTYPLAPVPKTGQTASHGTRDDGALGMGVSWPVPRFTDNSNGTVIDNLTGLIWLKWAWCEVHDPVNWATALAYANALYDGCAYCFGTSIPDLPGNDCRLSDGSNAGDWRLPNVRELQSLIDYGRGNPALPSGHPFTNVRSAYWSSSTVAGNPGWAWCVSVGSGYVEGDTKGTGPFHYVWPVRGGQ